MAGKTLKVNLYTIVKESVTFILSKIYALMPMPITYISELERTLKECTSILDVGCGSHSPVMCIQKKNFDYVGIDIYKPSIDMNIRMQKTQHNSKYMCINIRLIDNYFKKESFDCVVALDVIEHLSKKEGLDLINQMEKIAKRRIVIFTPNGFLPQGEYDKNPWQIHKSGWTVKEMRAMGYTVLGINGFKPLRGEYARFKFRPRLLWAFISEITQIIVRNKPDQAFSLLCIKDK